MALDSIPVTTAQSVSLFVECILYGIYLVTLVQCLRGLLWSETDHKIKSKINWPMLVVAVLFCIFATLDVTFGLRHNLVAFVYYTGPGGASQEFEDISYWVNVMRTMDYAVQTLIGNAMLIYRCYIVYNRKWKIIIPSFVLWLGGLICGIKVIITFSTLHTHALLNTSQVEPYVDTALSITLAMNIITTSLIVYRIWSVDKETTRMTISHSPPHRISRLRYVITIVVESAALYTLSVLVFVCTYAAKNNGNYVISCGVIPIIGISFNLIIARVSAHRSFEGVTLGGNSLTSIKFRENRPLTEAFATMKSCSASTSSHNPSLSPKGPPLEVNVLREIDYTSDHGSNRIGERFNNVDLKPETWDVA